MKLYFRMIFYTFFMGFILALVTPFSDIYVASEIKPYHDEFVNIVEKRCTKEQYFSSKYKMEFNRLNNSIIGICMPRPDRFVIYIDYDYWNRKSEDDRRSLVFHELAHCMLNLNHVPDVTNFMYYSDIYINSKEELYEQLESYLDKICEQKGIKNE